MRHREYLADLEHALKSNGTSNEQQQQIRQIVIPNLSRHRPFNALSRQESAALRSLKKDSSIVILPADKGRTTVILNKMDYVEKAMTLLRDSSTYSIMANDQTSRLSAKINNTLKKLQDLKELTKEGHWRMKSTDSTIARLYGLPRIPQTRCSPETNRIITEFTDLQAFQRVI